MKAYPVFNGTIVPYQPDNFVKEYVPLAAVVANVVGPSLISTPLNGFPLDVTVPLIAQDWIGVPTKFWV